MKRLVLAIILLASFLAITQFSGGNVGTSMQCSNGRCLVAASSSLISTGLGLLLFFIIIYLPRKSITAMDKAPGFGRKIGALFIDMFLTLMGFSALLSLPVLIAEYSYTGSFQWAFVRDFARPTDWALILSAVFASFAIILFMRIRSTTSGSPSFGQYLLGYRVTGEKGGVDSKTAFKRAVWTTLYLTVWPVYLLYKLIKKPKKDSWDTRCNTKSEKFQYS